MKSTHQVSDAMQNLQLFHAATHSSSVSKRFFSRPEFRFFFFLRLLCCPIQSPLPRLYLLWIQQHNTRPSVHAWIFFFGGVMRSRGLFFCSHFLELHGFATVAAHRPATNISQRVNTLPVNYYHSRHFSFFLHPGNKHFPFSCDEL